jgi:hypothetical protein
VLGILGGWYKTLLNFPDGQIGWLPFAVRAAHQICRNWRPDVILGSALPMTSLLVAERVAKKHKVPWIAELRDLGVDGHNYGQPAWRRRIETFLERKSLSSAKGFITVSEPLAETLRASYGKPTAVVLNGYDPADYLGNVSPPTDDGPLRIVYTGMVYEGKQQVAPLFEALRALGALSARVRVSFYGRYLQSVATEASRMGVGRLVEIHPPVSHRESLGLQCQADVLLLLLWNAERQAGVYTGKLFEYIGARRPILAIGNDRNVAAQLIADRGAGVVLTNSAGILEQLRRWILQKQNQRFIAPPDPEAALGLTREEQTRKLEAFLNHMVGGLQTDSTRVDSKHAAVSGLAHHLGRRHRAAS